MPSGFSTFDRLSILKNLQTTEFDLLIIGGGITGAGIALDAAARGLKTALVEKNDFAYGTSSRSTKLIHGGLRYLKQLEFGLVKEVGSERAVVHKLAPHLVVPEKMLLPLSEKKGLGYWLTSIGLKIYDWLAGVSPADKRKMLTRQQTLKHEPLLRKDDIKGGAIYAEYRTDDARLTIEVIKTANGHGAVIASYLCVNDFVYDNGIICGVLVYDALEKSTFTIKTKVVVSAAGPWVDKLRDVNKSKIGKRLHLTKGVHIVVSYTRFPVRQAIYFDVEDGRMIFAIPRGNKTYIGTTDTNYNNEDIDQVKTSHEDADYLLQAVNAMFPSVLLRIEDVESSWAGLRPLIHEEGKSASDLSRKDEIFESPSGLISIAGGKLTGYRKMAERVVSLVIKKHFSNRKFNACITNSIKLTGADFHDIKEVKDYINSISKQLITFELPSSYAPYLVHNYGRQSNDVLALLNSNTHTDKEIDLALAELTFTMQHEMALTPHDFFIRRTGMLYFNIARMDNLIDPVLEAFKIHFIWDAQTTNHYREALLKEMNNARNFNY